MAKGKDTVFYCKECGYESPKWAGQCPACHEWNTLVEAPASSVQKRAGLSGGIRQPGPGLKNTGFREARSCTLTEIEFRQEERYVTGIEEFDRVLGGGIIRDGLILVGGDPGIGKSTLLTQVCKALSDQGIRVLYISGEESLSQIKLRANRLGSFTEQMKLLCETDLDVIEGILQKEQPQVCIIDSIQTMYRPDVPSAPGSSAQVRESTNLLMQWAKVLGIAIFVVGHVTKEGVVAGPRMLEHMVDTVLYFEGDSRASYRILRGVKNRFGSTNEIGVFEMRSSGLEQVPNPSEYMLNGRPVNSSGSVVTCTIEGTRPILAEIQALVARTGLNNPRRSATGLDFNRLNLLVAVLEKRLGLRMSECDAYVNIAGGMRISETAPDLAVIIALASGYLDYVVPADVMAVGEVGLSGEVRNVNQMENRVKEAVKMGFVRCIVPASSLKLLKSFGDVRLLGVSNVTEAIELLRKMQK
ncbi:MAG: DNA repair protein RadA [Parasporobacterium sp.]|nr:DNA repair protein RadA [Parasporobacterium sp.]